MISTALYNTPHARRYLQQLAKHFAHKIEVRLEDESADFALQAGTVRLDADDTALRLRIEADDAKAIIDTRYVVDKHLVIFAFREGFAGLDWRVEPVPA